MQMYVAHKRTPWYYGIFILRERTTYSVSSSVFQAFHNLQQRATTPNTQGIDSGVSCCTTRLTLVFYFIMPRGSGASTLRVQRLFLNDTRINVREEKLKVHGKQVFVSGLHNRCRDENGIVVWNAIRVDASDCTSRSSLSYRVSKFSRDSTVRVYSYSHQSPPSLPPRET